ncbi:hypothetical protein EDB81DRAFT_912439 [Dactylonectria macrodidyma]|uniref:Uncharacterized protein n=1 Tax=Dactylonectria macrodidyma TaxID=307937 RepID=A0A9P9DPC5_9HYPO|nr:hypothetical protein EDB81DRAFT_912439 [Dactylonectria macrodidyma]
MDVGSLTVYKTDLKIVPTSEGEDTTRECTDGRRNGTCNCAFALIPFSGGPGSLLGAFDNQMEPQTGKYPKKAGVDYDKCQAEFDEQMVLLKEDIKKRLELAQQQREGGKKSEPPPVWPPTGRSIFGATQQPARQRNRFSERSPNGSLDEGK